MTCANPACGQSLIRRLAKTRGNYRVKYCSNECRSAAWRGTSKFNKALPTGVTGAVNELLVCADLLARGFPVFRAVSPSSPCDAVILVGTKPFRVEVTTGFKPLVSSKPHFTPHNPSRFDILAVVFRDGTITYTPELPEIGLAPDKERHAGAGQGHAADR